MKSTDNLYRNSQIKKFPRLLKQNRNRNTNRLAMTLFLPWCHSQGKFAEKSIIQMPILYYETLYRNLYMNFFLVQRVDCLDNKFISIIDMNA